jgi:hypothetical protein
MVKFGMPPADVLRADLINGARLLRWADEIGQLKPGFYADVIAVPGNPLEDISVLTKSPSFVMKNGEVLRKIRLAGLLGELGPALVDGVVLGLGGFHLGEGCGERRVGDNGVDLRGDRGRRPCGRRLCRRGLRCRRTRAARGRRASSYRRWSHLPRASGGGALRAVGRGLLLFDVALLDSLPLFPLRVVGEDCARGRGRRGRGRCWRRGRACSGRG